MEQLPYSTLVPGEVALSVIVNIVLCVEYVKIQHGMHCVDNVY